MQDASFLLLLIPAAAALSARSIFGPVYEYGRSRVHHEIVFIRSDVQDGRSLCDVSDVLSRFDASACDVPLPDIKAIDETDHRKIITMCFGLYDLLYEICSLGTGNRTVGNVLNCNFRESQKPSDFCVEAGEAQLASIRHTDPIFDKWADYLKKLFLKQELCEELCQLQFGVHIICKLILAGHRYLSMTSVYICETTSLPAPIHVVNGMNEDASLIEAESTTVFAEVDATKDIDSGLNAIEYHDWISNEGKKKNENNSDESCEGSSTKHCIGIHGRHQGEGAGGLTIWFAVLFFVTLLTVIALVACFIRKKAVDTTAATRAVFRWGRSGSVHPEVESGMENLLSF